jgi:hypothetical protein
MRRQQIDDLAFAFIAPLRAEHRQIHIGLRFYLQIIFHSTKMLRSARARRVKEKIFHFQFDNTRAAS